MGRTNTTYRRFLESYKVDCQPFERALRRRYEEDFEQLFAHADRFADAAGYLNRTDPEMAVMLSILLAQEHERRQLAERVEALESGGE